MQSAKATAMAKYHCKLCSFATSFSNQFQNHMVNMHGSNARVEEKESNKWHCKLCNVRADNKKSWMQHVEGIKHRKAARLASGVQGATFLDDADAPNARHIELLAELTSDEEADPAQPSQLPIVRIGHPAELPQNMQSSSKESVTQALPAGPEESKKKKKPRMVVPDDLDFDLQPESGASLLAQGQKLHIGSNVSGGNSSSSQSPTKPERKADRSTEVLSKPLSGQTFHFDNMLEALMMEQDPRKPASTAEQGQPASANDDKYESIPLTRALLKPSRRTAKAEPAAESFLDGSRSSVSSTSRFDATRKEQALWQSSRVSALKSKMQQRHEAQAKNMKASFAAHTSSNSPEHSDAVPSMAEGSTATAESQSVTQTGTHQQPGLPTIQQLHTFKVSKQELGEPEAKTQSAASYDASEGGITSPNPNVIADPLEHGSGSANNEEWPVLSSKVKSKALPKTLPPPNPAPKNIPPAQAPAPDDEWPALSSILSKQPKQDPAQAKAPIHTGFKASKSDLAATLPNQIKPMLNPLAAEFNPLLNPLATNFNPKASRSTAVNKTDATEEFPSQLSRATPLMRFQSAAPPALVQLSNVHPAASEAQLPSHFVSMRPQQPLQPTIAENADATGFVPAVTARSMPHSLTQPSDANAVKLAAAVDLRPTPDIPTPNQHEAASRAKESGVQDNAFVVASEGLSMDVMSSLFPGIDQPPVPGEAPVVLKKVARRSRAKKAPKTAAQEGSLSKELGEDVRDLLSCPITLELMRDPVLAGDGHTYERAAIEDWLAKSQDSPLTGEPLDVHSLLPNNFIKQFIDRFHETMPT